MRELTPVQNMIFRVGAVLMLVGAAVHVVWPLCALIVYSLGVLAFSLMQMKAEYMGRNQVLVRLRRQQLLSDVCFVLVAICMAMQTFHFGMAQRNEWVVALAIGCLLQLYTAWRIPSELQKEH